MRDGDHQTNPKVIKWITIGFLLVIILAMVCTYTGGYYLWSQIEKDGTNSKDYLKLYSNMTGVFDSTIDVAFYCILAVISVYLRGTEAVKIIGRILAAKKSTDQGKDEFNEGKKKVNKKLKKDKKSKNRKRSTKHD